MKLEQTANDIAMDIRAHEQAIERAEQQARDLDRQHRYADAYQLRTQAAGFRERVRQLKRKLKCQN